MLPAVTHNLTIECSREIQFYKLVLAMVTPIKRQTHSTYAHVSRNSSDNYLFPLLVVDDISALYISIFFPIFDLYIQYDLFFNLSKLNYTKILNYQTNQSSSLKGNYFEKKLHRHIFCDSIEINEFYLHSTKKKTLVHARYFHKLILCISQRILRNFHLATSIVR